MTSRSSRTLPQRPFPCEDVREQGDENEQAWRRGTAIKLEDDAEGVGEEFFEGWRNLGEFRRTQWRQWHLRGLRRVSTQLRSCSIKVQAVRDYEKMKARKGWCDEEVEKQKRRLSIHLPL